MTRPTRQQQRQAERRGRKNTRRRQQRRTRPGGRVTPAASWRRRNADRGATWSGMASNLPNHDPSTPAQQAAWADEMLEHVDVLSVAECTPTLARAVDRYPGVNVSAATPNYGGNGNVLATRHKIVRRDQYQCSFRATSGRSYLLHMARAEIKKQRTRCTFDAVHLPPKGDFDTSSTPAERARVIHQIARRQARTKARVVMGDWNTDVETVLHELRKVDPRWVHLGGRGVEQVFGIGVADLGDVAVTYARVTDHHVTAKVKIGVTR